MTDCLSRGRTRRGMQRAAERTRPLVARSVIGVAYLAAITVIAVALTAGHAAGHYPNIPLEQVADVVVVIKPYQKHSLQLPATVDRIVQGDIVRVEKGVAPLVIVHTRNSFTSPIEAGVPVKLYLKAFKDGHGHYIIGVSSAPSGSQP
jgi:hypothetical protein